MAKQKERPTLEEIATDAGVSVSTVSRVINNSGPVKRELEVRVRESMKILGLAKPRPDIIACIVPEFQNPANTQIISGIQDEAEKMGLHLLFVPVSEKAGSLHQNLQILKHLAIDGIILHHLGTEPEEVLEVCNRTDIPMVVLRKDVNTPLVHRIDTDRENGMFQAAKLLINLGHQAIAYLCGMSESGVAQARLAGIKRALNDAGLSLKPELLRECFSTTDDGFRVATNLLQLPVAQRPTAIMAYNDLVAIGALHAIRVAGLSIPNDISVVGFDNIPLTSHTNPPLTTVAQPHYQKGQLAVQKLFHSLNDRVTDQEGLTLLECSLIVRESTGVCKK